MIFTTENILDNIEKLGPWSAYGLASDALRYYFPKEYENGEPPARREGDLIDELGLNCWIDVVEKYHKEVGYKPVDGKFNTCEVNELCVHLTINIPTRL